VTGYLRGAGRCSLVGARTDRHCPVRLAPLAAGLGAVVEAWVESSARLVAAARVPDDHQDEDVLTFTVPLGAPLAGRRLVTAG
jgi:hypothetical protein